MGQLSLLTPRAKSIIEQAELVIATDRLYDSFAALNPHSISLPFSAIVHHIAEQDGLSRVAILASGDVGFFSISKLLGERLAEHDIEFVNGLSSMQYFAARLGINYDDAVVVSLHGRENCILPYIAYNRKVFALTGGKTKAHDLLCQLVEAGLGNVQIFVGENLSADNERILCGNASDLIDESFADLAVVFIINEKYVDCSSILHDSDFIRGKTPMTKQEIRDLSLAKLEIWPEATVYDLGAGTGSVSVAMARRAHRGMVYAVERNPEALSLIRENVAKLGAYNVCVVSGSAPDVLTDLPVPDIVFIGGSGGNMADIFAAVLAKNPRVRIVVNAVTMETVAETAACFAANNINTDTVCVNIAKAEPLGRYTMMKAQNPIYIISGTAKGDRHE